MCIGRYWKLFTNTIQFSQRNHIISKWFFFYGKRSTPTSFRPSLYRKVEWLICYCERLINSSRLDDAMKMDTRTINKLMGLDTKPLVPPNRTKPRKLATREKKKIKTYLGIGVSGKKIRPMHLGRATPLTIACWGFLRCGFFGTDAVVLHS